MAYVLIIWMSFRSGALATAEFSTLAACQSALEQTIAAGPKWDAYVNKPMVAGICVPKSL
jgi:hypothetical protein